MCFEHLPIEILWNILQAANTVINMMLTCKTMASFINNENFWRNRFFLKVTNGKFNIPKECSHFNDPRYNKTWKWLCAAYLINLVNMSYNQMSMMSTKRAVVGTLRCVRHSTNVDDKFMITSRGQFINGKLHGYGVKTSVPVDTAWHFSEELPPGADCQEGNFQDGKYSGYGYWTAEGQQYIGETNNEMKHGHGQIIIIETGDIYEDIWKHDNPDYDAIHYLTYPNGDRLSFKMWHELWVGQQYAIISFTCSHSCPDPKYRGVTFNRNECKWHIVTDEETLEKPYLEQLLYSMHEWHYWAYNDQGTSEDAVKMFNQYIANGHIGWSKKVKHEFINSFKQNLAKAQDDFKGTVINWLDQ